MKAFISCSLSLTSSAPLADSDSNQVLRHCRLIGPAFSERVTDSNNLLIITLGSIVITS